ncbi:hypothetical protein EAO71_36935, partial [Streptomyces sp. ms191]|uniref:hypothetical protein n=1 Tax=Streptomyces sp. ms191 TaxID=1827978 RepID=UPI001311806F
VVDPTGAGLADLRARPRRLTSLHSTDDRLDQARLILRAVKFAVRWAGTTGCELGATAARLAHVPTTAWGRGGGPGAGRQPRSDDRPRVHGARLPPPSGK